MHNAFLGGKRLTRTLLDSLIYAVHLQDVNGKWYRLPHSTPRQRTVPVTGHSAYESRAAPSAPSRTLADAVLPFAPPLEPRLLDNQQIEIKIIDNSE